MLPPGRLLIASLWRFRLVVFLFTKRDFAAKRASWPAPWPVFWLTLVVEVSSTLHAAEDSTREGAMMDGIKGFQAVEVLYVGWTWNNMPVMLHSFPTGEHS